MRSGSSGDDRVESREGVGEVGLDEDAVDRTWQLLAGDIGPAETDQLLDDRCLYSRRLREPGRRHD